MLKRLFFSNTLEKGFFYLPNIHLRFMGFDGVNSLFRTPKSSLWSFRNFFLFALALMAHWNGVCFVNCIDIIDVFSKLCPLLTGTVFLLKGSLLRYQYKSLQTLLQQQFQLLFNTEPAIEEPINKIPNNREIGKKRQTEQLHNSNLLKRNRIIRNSMITANIMNVGTLIMDVGTLLFYILNTIFDALQQWRKGKDVIWTLPFELGLPRFMMEGPLFLLAYVFSSYYGCLIVATIGCSDGVYMEFCAHTSSLFKLLQMDLRQIFDRIEDRLILTGDELQHIELELIQIIQRHSAIMDLFERFRKIYTVIALIHFISASLVIGMTIFNIISVPGLSKLIYCFYSAAVLFQLAIYCYGGTLIAENSTSLANATSCSNWNVYQPKLRTLLIMIIMRAQKPVMMKVPFFTLSLLTFTSILQASGSLITFALSFR